MKKQFLFLTLTLLSTLPSYAFDLSEHEREQIILGDLPIQMPENIDWKVGEYQDRQVLKSGIKGATVKSWIDREEGNGFWMINDLKVILKSKERHEILIERKSGKAIRYIVDGKEKTPPDLKKSADCEDVAVSAEKVKVPAGTFNSIRTQVQCTEEGYVSWVATQKMSMGGMLKQFILDENQDANKPEYIVELVKFGNL